MAKQELYVIGIPGGGKTTWLSQQVSEYVEAGHIPFVSSLTRAAAIEIASRGLPVDDRMVGTLHSMAYHAIGGAEIIETDRKLLEEWNRDHPGNEVSGKTADDAFGVSGANLLNEAFRFRHRREKMPDNCADILVEWDEFKDSKGVVDFTDLLEFALDTDSPGYYPTAYFIDEAQDLSRLEVELMMKWASHPDVDNLICVGDPDQAIYGFRSGAGGELFRYDGVKDIRVLEQSFRVPRKPQAFARDWIRQSPERYDYTWNPTDAEGEVLEVPTDSDGLVDSFPETGSIMVLASAAYMLDDVIKRLDARGITYHNPYRRNEARWNPLGATRGNSTKTRMLAFLKPMADTWTEDDIKMWAPLFPATKVFRERGMKSKLDKGNLDRYESNLEMNRILLNDDLLYILDNLYNRNEIPAIRFIEENIVAGKRSPATRLLNFINAESSDVLEQEPRVVVGTIHSVKGGEAETVYVLDGLSPAAERESSPNIWDDPELRRLFYVAFTRTSNSLRLSRVNRSAHFAHRYINNDINRVGEYA